MLAEPAIACPYCGESFTILVDCSAGDQQYVEDCFVCCQPIVLSTQISPDGELLQIEAVAENG